MTATSTTTAPTSGTSPGGPAFAPVRLASRGLRQDLRTISVVWRRELLQFRHAPARALSSFIQPLLFLFVLGAGLGSVIRPGGAAKFSTFLFPGVLATSVMFTAVFSGISMIWDRQLGFLREMLVAPVRRGAILIGKCLGGATIATGQSVVLLALCGLVGVPYDPAVLVALVLLMFVGSFAITSCGVLIGVRLKQMQAAMPITQLVITPMMFLSGSLFPLSGLPGWLHVATRLNPLTYAVDPMRTVVFAHLNIPPATRAVFDPGVTWAGWRVPAMVEVGVVLAVGVILLSVATALFNREG
ncbi:MAG: type transport system permease protein [Mycobacteriales bacterium]|jgi:ABC-2 type transport system permease protein